ncbi:MAG TPA: hypothetical protein P5234_07555 [Thermoanaerobaculaceae bacterium]|nr:hypothetical protein [Thermoanaerobaculaceae bacterium]HRS16094.1 hypothetical protein [Thermoanaerobaculaceae bacterium]
MQRPNLARDRFENSRPVWTLGAALAVVAAALSVVSVSELLGARSVEQDQIEQVRALRARRDRLAREVAAADRELGAVGWRKLQAETAAFQEVVARRQLSWSQMLADLERVVPWNVRLVSVTPAAQKEGSLRLTLRGVAVSREAWLGLLAALFADPSFSDPVPASEDSPASSGGQGYQVSLSVTYWPGGRP